MLYTAIAVVGILGHIILMDGKVRFLGVFFGCCGAMVLVIVTALNVFIIYVYFLVSRSDIPTERCETVEGNRELKAAVFQGRVTPSINHTGESSDSPQKLKSELPTISKDFESP